MMMNLLLSSRNSVSCPPKTAWNKFNNSIQSYGILISNCWQQFGGTCQQQIREECPHLSQTTPLPATTRYITWSTYRRWSPWKAHWFPPQREHKEKLWHRPALLHTLDGLFCRNQPTSIVENKNFQKVKW